MGSRCVPWKVVWVAAFISIAAVCAGAEPARAATLQVSWASNTEADLAGYRLRWGTVSGQYTQTIDAGTSSSQQVDNLDTGVTYYLAVFAYDFAGNESAPSPEVSALVPTAPDLLPILDAVTDVDSASIYLMRGVVHTVIVQGRNIQDGATIRFGPGTLATRLAMKGDGTLSSTVLVSASASPGLRTLTVTNPDLGTTSVSDAMAVVKTPDTNNDCAADILDLNAIARSWNASSGDPGYSDSSDLDGDAYVGPEDLTIFVKFLGRPVPGCP